jgi:hypothetical protein
MREDQTVIDKGQAMANNQLTANLVNGQVIITGSQHGPANVPKGSPPERFTFNLDDNTGLNIQFLSAPAFVCADESGGCPACGSGIQTDQITNPVSSNRTASFTDQNSRACTIGYSLCFSCDNGSTPRYDPIIINGGPSTT